jgi:hypothetical protein
MFELFHPNIAGLAAEVGTGEGFNDLEAIRDRFNCR